jgi:hypothetical protein
MNIEIHVRLSASSGPALSLRPVVFFGFGSAQAAPAASEKAAPRRPAPAGTARPASGFGALN